MENIHDLIAAGRIEEALDILSSHNQDAILLKSRYNSGKRQYSMGLVDFGEWQRVQNQIAYAAMELAGDAAKKPTGAPAGATGSDASPPTASSTRKKVFISYNHADADTAIQLRDAFKQAGLDVIIDRDSMPAGMEILEFIQQSIKNADAVVSVVSAKSLQSGWVGQESVASFYAMWLADKQFIPVRLDDVVFDIDFQIEVQEQMNAKIEELDGKLERLRKAGGNTVAFEKNRQRMFELKSNLGNIVDRLSNVLILDIRPPHASDTVQRIIKALQP